MLDINGGLRALILSDRVSKTELVRPIFQMEYLCSEFNGILFVTLRTQIYKYTVLNVDRLQGADATT